MASHEREAIFVRRLFWCMLCHEVLVGCTRRCEHIELGMGNDYGIPFVDGDAAEQALSAEWRIEVAFGNDKDIG